MSHNTATHRVTQSARGARLPKATPVALNTFVSMLYRSPLYEVGSTLRPAKLNGTLHHWLSPYELDFSWKNTSFIDLLVKREKQNRTWTSGSAWHLKRACVDSDRETGFEVKLSEVGEGPERFWATEEDLQEIAFETISEVRLIHPLNREVRQFNSQSKTLTSIVEELASLADLDYVIQSNRSDDVVINQFLRGRTILECLETIAEAADWKVNLIGAATDVADSIISFGDILQRSLDDQRSAPAAESNSGVARIGDGSSPLDALGALGALVESEANAIKRQAIVVTLTPKAYTTVTDAARSREQARQGNPNGEHSESHEGGKGNRGSRTTRTTPRK